MSREYPERPIVGVGAVIWREDRVLLVRRGKPPRMDEWSLPGGAQRLGETVEQAALREIKEETNLEIKIVKLIDVVDAIFPDCEGSIEHHYTLIDFVALAPIGEAIAGDDVADVRWVSLDELANYHLWDETVRIISQSKQLLNDT